MQNLIPVHDRKALDDAGIPFASQTLYNWWHKGKNKFIFRKISSRLFIVQEKWAKLVH